MAFEISLKGKTALVTGGARGIGAEVCRGLALAGANIAVNHHHLEADRMAARRLLGELDALGARSSAYETDISVDTEVADMVDAVAADFGGIDILVNNAGITGSPARIEELSLEQWKMALDVNLTGAFLVTRRVIRHMYARNSGCIIMVSSGTAINGGGGTVGYPASKAGMEGMVRQLVRECSPRGVRVNIVQPAVIDTDLLRQRYPTDEDIAGYGKSIPIGRVGKPEDIANAVIFLVSDKATYITGARLLVDGGRTLYKN